MKAGILAAGRGERLRTLSNPLKPLTRVGGRTLIEHVLSSFAEAGVSDVVVLINEDSLAVRDHAGSKTWPFSLRWVIETTPSSMHTFLRLVETLASDGDDGPFLLSTVDTVARAQTYAAFVLAARQHEAADVTLALTAPGNDDNPLYVRLSPEDSRVTAIGPEAAPSNYATAGIYAVRATVLREADAARREGLDALRMFLGRLLATGYRLDGIPIAQSIDVDRAVDIATAEAILGGVSS